MDTLNKIKKQISSNDLIIYIKGTPENPMCGFSSQVVHIFNLFKLNYVYVDIIKNGDIRQYLPKYSGWPTFPQVFYKGNLIGGCDIISEMYKNGTLKNELSK